jgi:hypothetical protein
MHTPNQFLTRAAECEAMAKIAREPDSRAVWTRMAERWHRCAEVEMRANSPHPAGAVISKRVRPSWRPRHWLGALPAR